MDRLTRLPVGVRYALVSGLCLTLNNIIIIAADWAGRGILVGVAIAHVLVGTIAYLLHARYTFPASLAWSRYARYLTALSANLPLSIASLWIFATALALPMSIAAPVASFCMIVVNFYMSRVAVRGRGDARALRDPAL